MNNRGEIKLADFGMARQFSDPPPSNLTRLVVTLWRTLGELGGYSLISRHSYLSISSDGASSSTENPRVSSINIPGAYSRLEKRHIKLLQRSVRTHHAYSIEECFAILERYSFLQWKKDQQSYVMHKLVHAWDHYRLTKDEQLQFSHATFKIIVKAIDGCRNTPEDKLRLVPHIMANFATLTSASGTSD
jgi:hypothetical protein